MSNINWTIVTPSLWTGAAGIAVGAFAMVQVFGFMSPTSAAKIASEKSDTAVIAALAPSCAADFRALPDAKDRMATLVANKDSYSAKDAFPEALVTLPGHGFIDHGLVRACESLLLAPPKSAMK